MNHTPGPWERCSHGRIYYIKAEGGDIVAETEPPATGSQSANAELIAAAPDLLVVCEQVLAWASADTEEGGDFAYFSEHIWQRLEDAVKEAKGE